MITSQEFLDLVQTRYSVRSYADKPVEEEKIQQILQAAMLAPTAKNNQPQKIYVLKSAEAIQKVREVTRCAYNAPVVFILCSDTERSWQSPFVDDYQSGEMDASITCTHMMLEATTLGLGSVWVLYFDPAKLREAFNLPANIIPHCLLPVGYASTDAEPSPKHSEYRALSEMVTEL